MKVALYSDIHANSHALNALYTLLNADRVHWCLGDLVGRGDHAVEVVQGVKGVVEQRPYHVCLMGNHDATALRKRHKSHDDTGDLRHGDLLRHHDEKLWQWMGERPVQANPIEGCYLAHDAYDIAPPSVDKRVWIYTTLGEENRLQQMQVLRRTGKPLCMVVVGHSHVPYLSQWNVNTQRFQAYEPFKEQWYTFENLATSPLLINTGSVGYPRQQSPYTYILADLSDYPKRVRLGFRSIYPDVW